MPTLRALGASFAYTDAVPLFSDATFHLEGGWTGVVGPNGAGKTTLLRVLAGELALVSGALQLRPDPPLVHLCEQRVERLSEAIRDFAQSWERGPSRLRGELGLDPSELERWDTLSPGERKRWQVAAAVALAPDLLLLDEPTNHLDVDGRRWLMGALRRYRGLGMVVSHDRALLDELTQHTLRLHRGALTLWSGSYSAARAQWDAARAGEEARYAAAQEQRRKAQQALHQARASHAGASAQTSAGRRMKSKYDSDARGIGADFRAAQAEKKLGREVSTLRKELARVEARADALAFEKDVGRPLLAGYDPCPRPTVLELSADGVWAQAARILGPVSLVLRREERVHLRGANGAGKTTLLRALLAASTLPDDKYVYLPQELSADEAREVLRRVKALPPEVRGRVLSFVAALGVDPDRLLPSESPSPGEARKLLIAEGLGRHAWLLVLDEPTNHLDLPSIERLEAALADWPGALLLVTHDEPFAARVCGARWEVDGGSVTLS